MKIIDMIDKLISTTEFILKLDGTKLNKSSFNEDISTRISLVNKYARFASLPLKLEMFIPTDIYGKILEYCENPKGSLINTKEVNAYNFAKSKVLFKDFEQEDWIEEFGYITLRLKRDDSLYSINYNVETKEFFFDGDNCDIPCKTVEGLLPCNIELTEACLKQLNLN